MSNGAHSDDRALYMMRMAATCTAITRRRCTSRGNAVHSEDGKHARCSVTGGICAGQRTRVTCAGATRAGGMCWGNARTEDGDGGVSMEAPR